MSNLMEIGYNPIRKVMMIKKETRQEILSVLLIMLDPLI